MAKETLKQRDKRDLDLQLDTELKGTFPASDPLTITRFPYKKRSAKPSIGDNADDPRLRRSMTGQVAFPIAKMFSTGRTLTSQGNRDCSSQAG